MRIDLYLVEKGLVKSRERAKELIKSGKIIADGKVISKPSVDVNNDINIEIKGEQLKYVGRGGLKLEKALNEFNINLCNRICIDIGASTGGFTDCMLQNGASYVYAVDVGHDQLDERLKNDIRVCNMERNNIKNMTSDNFPLNPSFISVDVSFVSLTQIIPKIKELLPINGEAIMLIKPQFEAGKSLIGKKGIVKDPKVHMRVIEDIILFCSSLNFKAVGLTFSPISGGDGNIEYLVHLKHGNEVYNFNIKELVLTAFSELK